MCKVILTRDKSFYRTCAKLALTLMLEQAVILSVNLADNLMLGAYSEASLSGVAAVNQIQFVLQQVAYALGNGMIVLASQYWGQKRLKEIRQLSSIALRGEILLSLLLFALVSLFPAGTLKLFTSQPMFISEGVKYLSIIRFSYLFFTLTAVLLSTMRVVEQVKIALQASILALAVNCTLNALLIYGRFGLPEMGVRGAAIGTLTARIVEFALVAYTVFFRDKRLSLRMRDCLHVDRVMLRDYLRVTLPVACTATLWGVSNALQTVILGHLDDSAIAAQSISSTVFLLLKVTSVGAASAASILIGKTIGEGKMEKLREYTRTLQLTFLAIGLTLALIMLCVRGPLLALYDISERTRELAGAYMLIQSVVLFTMSYQMPVNTGIIRGGGDTRFAMILDLVSIWGIVMPVSLLCAFVWKLSPIVVIIALNSDQVFKCIPACIRVKSYKWVRKLTRA